MMAKLKYMCKNGAAKRPRNKKKGFQKVYCSEKRYDRSILLYPFAFSAPTTVVEASNKGNFILG